jgi:phosphatidate cytidylyltransferase
MTSHEEIENLAKKGMSMKRKYYLSYDAYLRSLSSLVMFSVVALSIYLGKYGILSLLTFVSFLSFFEWFGLWATTHNTFSPWSIKILLIGFLYLGFSLYSLGTLGLYYPMHFFHMAIVTWTTDIFSYIIGVQLKSFEWYISVHLGQGKTWPGFWGGMFFGTFFPFLVFWGLQSKYNLAISNQNLFLKTLALSFFSQIGDITESIIKRFASKKDSSTFIFHIPGHGGVLDRIDGLLLASCVGYLYKDF